MASTFRGDKAMTGTIPDKYTPDARDIQREQYPDGLSATISFTYLVSGGTETLLGGD